VSDNTTQTDNTAAGQSQPAQTSTAAANAAAAADDDDVKSTIDRTLRVIEGDDSVTESLLVVTADGDANRTTSTDETSANNADGVSTESERIYNESVRTSRRQLRLMVAARVYVGQYTVGHRLYRKPPPLDPSQPYGMSFDSCVNYIDDPTLFVVFDSNQCYPEYFITYCCPADQNVT